MSGIQSSWFEALTQARDAIALLRIDFNEVSFLVACEASRLS